MTTGHFVASDSKCEEEMETQQWQVSSASQFCIGNLSAPKKSQGMHLWYIFHLLQIPRQAIRI